MGAHMQRSSDRPPPRLAPSKLPAAAATAAAAARRRSPTPPPPKDPCASAESSTSPHAPQDHGAAISLRSPAPASPCDKGLARLKPTTSVELNLPADFRGSAALRCTPAGTGCCQAYDRRCRRDGPTGGDKSAVGDVSEAAAAGLAIAIVEGVRHVCCMCGDAGIAELLFNCHKCSHRQQHIYCSRSYPNMSEEASICNWCLHEDDSAVVSCLTKASQHDEFINSKAVIASTSLSDIHHSTLLHDECARLGTYKNVEDEAMVAGPPLLNGHSKAFEYLLLAAAQIFPQVQRQTSSYRFENAQESLSIDSNSNRNSVSRGQDMAKNDATTLASILSLRHAEGKSPPSSVQHESTSSVISLGDNQNVIGINQAKISTDNRSIEFGGLIAGSLSKRHRCSKGINAALKCRKKGLQLSPSKPNYRRYKLLADVVC